MSVANFRVGKTSISLQSSYCSGKAETYSAQSEAQLAVVLLNDKVSRSATALYDFVGIRGVIDD